MTPRLLLVDDDSRLASMVGDYLGRAGFEVETAGSLAGGRDLLAANSYDALVLDLMLPDGDGLDLCREVRSASKTRQLPLLMLTARGEPMDRIVGLELGADDYCPNRSSRASCSPASRRSCAASRRRRPATRCCASAGSRSTSARASPASTASTCCDACGSPAPCPS